MTPKRRESYLDGVFWNRNNGEREIRCRGNLRRTEEGVMLFDFHEKECWSRNHIYPLCFSSEEALNKHLSFDFCFPNNENLILVSRWGHLIFLKVLKLCYLDGFVFIITSNLFGWLISLDN